MTEEEKAQLEPHIKKVQILIKKGVFAKKNAEIKIVIINSRIEAVYTTQKEE